MELKIIGLDDLKMDFINYGKYNNVAVGNAIKKTCAIAKNAGLKAVREQKWNISSTELKNLTKAPKFKASTLTYTFEMNSSPISLIKFKGTSYFSNSQLLDMKRKSKAGVGVRYKLKGKGRFKTLSKSFVKPSIFGNHAETVFTRRKSPLGANITAQYSITPSSMFQQEGEDAFVTTVMNKFSKIYINQLKWKKII